MARPRKDKNDPNYKKTSYLKSEKIEQEIKMLYDGLDGLLDKFDEFNRNNSKVRELVTSMIKTSFKLGYLVSRKKQFDKITDEDFKKEMLL